MPAITKTVGMASKKGSNPPTSLSILAFSCLALGSPLQVSTSNLTALVWGHTCKEKESGLEES